MKQKMLLSLSLDWPNAVSIKKLFYVLSTCVCLLAACKKSSSNTEEKLISKVTGEISSCICNPYINKYLWKGEIVYLQYSRGANCTGVANFYNKNGERMTLEKEISFDKFLSESTFIKEIWSCKENHNISQ